MKKLLRLLPSPLYRGLRAIYRRLRPGPGPRGFAANPGALLTAVAPRLAAIPGWFNLDDMAHFTLVLETQSAAGQVGDLLEIGCYHGRSAALLATQLKTGERLILVDAFDLPLSDPYGDTPTPAGVRRNLAAAVPGLAEDRVDILRGYSDEIRLPAGSRVRFAHVDGGHDSATVCSDLALCARALVRGGVIAVDDYGHPQYPGVHAGVAAFLAAEPTFRVMADLNRAGALGRKLYLTRVALT